MQMKGEPLADDTTLSSRVSRNLSLLMGKKSNEIENGRLFSVQSLSSRVTLTLRTDAMNRLQRGRICYILAFCCMIMWPSVNAFVTPLRNKVRSFYRVCRVRESWFLSLTTSLNSSHLPASIFATLTLPTCFFC